MKICIATNTFTRSQGQGRVNFEIALAAAEAGHHVTCLAHTVVPDLHVHPRISWINLPDASWPVSILGEINFARFATKWLQEYDDQFDVIIGNGANTWYPVDLNIVHFVHSAWRQSPVHDSRTHRGPYGWYQWLYSFLNAQLERRVIPRADTIVAVSSKVEDELNAHGISNEQIRVIHNGVDTDEFKPGSVERALLDLPVEVPLAFFAGDIRTPRKNLDSILRALKHVPDLHLAVAGSVKGSPFPSMAKRLKVDSRTHFLGFRRNIDDLMRASDMFVFPSRYEACTLVLLEAMASGLPIITAETAGGAELVNDSCGIVLDEPDDIERLSRSMAKLVNNSDLRDSMSQSARETSQNYTWSKMTDKYLALMNRTRESKRDQVSV